MNLITQSEFLSILFLMGLIVIFIYLSIRNLITIIRYNRKADVEKNYFYILKMFSGCIMSIIFFIIGLVLIVLFFPIIYAWIVLG